MEIRLIYKMMNVQEKKKKYKTQVKPIVTEQQITSFVYHF